jgi:hypothetical protein
MEDVVGVLLTNEHGDERALLCWGRVHDVVDPQPIIDRVLRAGIRSHEGRALTAGQVCDDVGEVREFQYFFEGLMAFATHMAHPKSARRRRKLAKDDVAFQKSLYLLGPRRDRSGGSTAGSGVWCTHETLVPIQGGLVHAYVGARFLRAHAGEGRIVVVVVSDFGPAERPNAEEVEYSVNFVGVGGPLGERLPDVFDTFELGGNTYVATVTAPGLEDSVAAREPERP